MEKLTIDSFDVQKGHTIIEYRKFFASPYDKGKILSFDENELFLMDKRHKYWEIIDEKGHKHYYALPGRFKAFDESMHHIPYYRNKKPFAFAMSILGLCFTSCISSYYVGKKLNQHNFDDDIVVEMPLDKIANEYHQWRFENPTKDPFDHFSVAKFTNYAMAETLYDENDKYETILRDKVTAVGRGNTTTNILVSDVTVDISNAFVQNTSNVLEESISYSNNIMAPKVGKRDYCDGNEVISYNGAASSSTTIAWENELCNKVSKDDYIKKVGKNPNAPFLYSITKETVLTNEVYDEDPETGQKHFGNSSKKKNDDGTYQIDLDIHNTKGVAKYVKRMTYLSGKTPDFFKTVHLTFKVDKDLRITSCEVNEEYSVLMMNTKGHIKTNFYYEDKAVDIPKNPTSFDYSKFN